MYQTRKNDERGVPVVRHMFQYGRGLQWPSNHAVHTQTLHIFTLLSWGKQNWICCVIPKVKLSKSLTMGKWNWTYWTEWEMVLAICDKLKGLRIQTKWRRCCTFSLRCLRKLLTLKQRPAQSSCYCRLVIISAGLSSQVALFAMILPATTQARLFVFFSFSDNDFDEYFSVVDSFDGNLNLQRSSPQFVERFAKVDGVQLKIFVFAFLQCVWEFAWVCFSEYEITYFQKQK